MPPAAVDLRSDTVTTPTATMRAAMASADVGDDTYGEDPTVADLERRVATLVGAEAALFLPTATMANQVALLTLTRPGDAVVVGAFQHVVAHEHGALAAVAGVQPLPVPDASGLIGADQVAAAVAAARHHHPRPTLVCAENTHMAANGRPWPVEALAAVAEVGLPVHLDGARLFNAVVALDEPASAWGSSATTTTLCFSKGLSAPVGAALALPAEHLDRARRHRQRLGGAMRQSGVLAAACLVALDEMVDRLADDHRRAARLAGAVAARWPEAGLDPSTVSTNIVCWSPPDPVAVVAALGSAGVLVGTISPTTVRLVTHAGLDDADIDRAAEIIAAS